MRKIVIHRSEPDEEVPFWVECPSMGESMGEAIRMMREAIALYVEDLIAHSEPVPPDGVELVDLLRS